MLADTDTERDAFLAVVYANADWVRAEFDAIVAASWDEPPAGAERPDRPVAVPPPANGTGFGDDRMPAERRSRPGRPGSARRRAAGPAGDGRQRRRGRSTERGLIIGARGSGRTPSLCPGNDRSGPPVTPVG